MLTNKKLPSYIGEPTMSNGTPVESDESSGFFPCVESCATSQQEDTAARRRAILDYWYNGQLNGFRSLDNDEDASFWEGHFLHLCVAFNGAMLQIEQHARESNEAEAAAISDEVWEARQFLGRAFFALDNVRHSSGEFREELCRTFQRFYDWGNNRRLRACVYVVAGCLVSQNTLGSDKSRLLDCIHSCVQTCLNLKTPFDSEEAS